jgi:hypothetical protein
MIELDRVEAHSQTIRRAGAHPIGERSGLVWFTDPATQSSHVLEPQDLTEFNVILKLAQSRMRFAGSGMISRFYTQTYSARNEAQRT